MTPAWDIRADLAVVGSGVAGLTAALRAQAAGLRTIVVTKAAIGDGSTAHAQGGIAVALPAGDGKADDAVRHVTDTITAGAGLCGPAAVRAILADGPAALARLRRHGAVFDLAADGTLARGREGGHSAFRVLHAGGDATGAEVERALATAARHAAVPVLENHLVTDVLLDETGAAAGLGVLDASGGGAAGPGLLRAPAVLLATGGAGQLYQVTTNPAVATADGLALALRAGAAVADVEFVQFHPTVLYAGPGASRGTVPLITEALRGRGAVLIDGAGAPVMAGVHPLGDLAPRDVVSATMTQRLARAPGTAASQLFLDATALGADTLYREFPTVSAACLAAGIDPARQPIPVAPAAHYHCGGVVTGLDGATTVPGLYAAGEVARTGLHGANRLASNSLLEGLVMGERAADAIAARATTRAPAPPPSDHPPAKQAVPDLAALRALMSAHAAIGRDEAGLTAALTAITSAATTPPPGPADHEAAALTLAARAVLTAALARTESRGCHRRTDYPDPDDGAWRRPLTLRLSATGAPEPIPARVLAEVLT